MQHPLAGPLTGVRVVELSSTVAGPVCGRLFADFGADVIKIESADGDAGRNFGDEIDGIGLYGLSMQRNKRAIVLDLKADEGRQLALQLLDKADILVENFRPGVLERLGLGQAVLAARNPGLVMVRISGYGQDGPYKERPGYGAICEAVAGVRHMTGDPDRPPARCALPTTDYLTALYAAFGAMAALHERTRSGKGQVVDVALAECAFTQMEGFVAAYEKTGVVPMRQGPRLMNTAPNSIYPSKDGHWILIAANNDVIFRRLADCMDQAWLGQDTRYATQRARGERVDEVDAFITSWTLQYTAADILQRLGSADVPCARANTIADIFADPHFAQRDMLLQLPHPVLGSVTLPGVVPKFSRTPGRVIRTGPEIGQDTVDVLTGELSLTPAQVQALQQRGVIAQRPGRDG